MADERERLARLEERIRTMSSQVADHGERVRELEDWRLREESADAQLSRGQAAVIVRRAERRERVAVALTLANVVIAIVVTAVH